jgi:hypothetical protein
MARIMDERGGKMPVQQFVAERWNFEGYLRSQGLSKKDVAQDVGNSCSQLAQEHPEWSRERIRTALALSYLTMDLKEVAIARRFTLDDPAELGRRLRIGP